MVAFGGKLLLAMYGSHSGASRLSAVWRLSAFWRVRYRRLHCIVIAELAHSVSRMRVLLLGQNKCYLIKL